MSEFKRNFPGHGDLTLEELCKLSLSQLLNLRNVLKPEQPIKSFHTKAKANGAVWVLGRPVVAPKAEPVATATNEENEDMAKKNSEKGRKAKGTKAPKVKEAGTPVQARQKDLNFKGKPAAERKYANSGTFVEKFLVMASRPNGVTDTEYRQACKAKDTFRAIARWAAAGLGYGVKEIEEGRVALVDDSGRRTVYTPREAQ